MSDDRPQNSVCIAVAAVGLTRAMVRELERRVRAGTDVAVQTGWISHGARGPLQRLQARYPGRVTLRGLPDKFPFMSAYHLCDADGRNLRYDVNRRVMEFCWSADAELTRRAGLRWTPFRNGPVEGDIRCYLRMALGCLVEQDLYLYHVQLTQLLRTGTRALLLVPDVWWGRRLARSLADGPIEVATAGGGAFRYWSALARRTGAEVPSEPLPGTSGASKPTHNVSRHLEFHSLPAYDEKPVSEHPGRRAPAHRRRVAVVINEGLTTSDRNNAPWFTHGALSPDDLVPVWIHRLRSPNEEERALFARGARAYGDRRWPRERVELPRLRRTLSDRILTAAMWAHCVAAMVRGGLWVASRMAAQIAETVWWRRLALDEAVGVLVDAGFEGEYFARTAGVHMAGGAVVCTQRSLEYDNESIVSQRPADLLCVWGDHDLRTYSPPLYQFPAYALTGWQAGEPCDEQERARLDTFRRETFGDRPVVLLVDEPGVIYGAEKVHEFLMAILADQAECGAYTLVMKPKKAVMLDLLPDPVAAAMKAAVARGGLFMLTPETKAARAALIADVVVSVPSTAMLEAVVLGRRIAVFNPRRTVRRLFYEQGLEGQCIFDQMPALLQGLRRFVAGVEPGFGDASALRPRLDGFADGRGSARTAAAIELMLEVLAAGGTSAEAATATVCQYEQRFGPGVAGSWQSLWDARQGDQSGLLREAPVFVPALTKGAH